MNSKLQQHVIDRALARDAPKANAEYRNVWREDLADFIPLEVRLAPISVCMSGRRNPASNISPSATPPAAPARTPSP